MRKLWLTGPKAMLDSGKSIVVCDAERHIVRLIEVNLKRQGHTVYTADNAASALDLVRLHSPQVLVVSEIEGRDELVEEARNICPGLHVEPIGKPT